MAFGDFRVVVLGADDRPGRTYGLRADAAGGIPRDFVQLDGVWHAVVRSAAEPDPESQSSSPTMITTVFCRRLDAVPNYLTRRKRRLSLVTDTHAHTPTLLVEVGPAPRARGRRRWVWLAVGVAVALLGAVAVATRRPAVRLPAAPEAASRPVAGPPRSPLPPAAAEPAPPAKVATPTTPKAHRKRRPKTYEEDIIDPWGNQ